jgi:hypothetical protein
MVSFTKREKSILTNIWKHKNTSNSQSNPEQKEQRRYDFKLYYRIIVRNSAWYWHKNRQKDQWNRRLSTNPCRYDHLIFDKGALNMCWRKDSIFNIWS